MLTETVATIDGEPISLAELLLDFKLRGDLHLLASAVTEAAVRRLLDQHAVEISDYELQRAADVWRQSCGLHRAVDTERWLAAHAMTLDDLELRLERDLRRRKVRDKVTSEQVRPYFDAHADDFAAASLAHVMTDDRRLADELHDRLGAPGAVFADVAAKLGSVVKEVAAHPRRYRRRELSPPVAAAVFAAHEGAMLPPIEVGMEHYVFRVAALHPPSLDAATREVIKDLLFEEWVAARLSGMHIEFLLPALLSANCAKTVQVAS